MDSVWTTSSFTTPKNNNVTNNGSLCCEARMLQEILKLNELMKSQTHSNTNDLRNHSNKVSPKNFIGTSTDQSNCSEGTFKDDEGEIHFQIMSKSISCLQGRNVSSSTTIVKMHSKTTLKKTGTESNNVPTRKDAASQHSPKQKYQSFEAAAETDVELDLINTSQKKSYVFSSSKNGENRISPNDASNVNERNTEDALLSCPFELVEIYSSKKEKNSENDFSKEYIGVNRRTSSMSVFPKGDSGQCKIVPEEKDLMLPKMKLDSENGENLTDCAQINTSDVKTVERIQEGSKIDKDFQKLGMQGNGTEIDMLKSDIQEDGKVDERFQKECPQEDQIYEDLPKKCPQEKQSKIIRASKFNESLNIASIKEQEKNNLMIEEGNSDETHRNVGSTSIAQELHNHNTENVNNFRAVYNRNSAEIDKYGNSIDSTQTEKNVSSAFEEGDRCSEFPRDNLDSNKHKISTSRSNMLNEDYANSSQSKISKVVLQSEKSNISKDSMDDLLSMKNTNDLKDRKSNCDGENTKAEPQSKENRMKIIIEKRENKQNDTTVNIIGNIKNASYDKNVQSAIINDKKERMQDLQDTCEEIMRVEIENAKHGVAMQESRSISVNYDTNICKTLTKIYERITCDWERIEDILIRLQSTITMNTAKSMMTLQLLDKTIARCKSYIHGANDSCEAESEIARLLSKYIVELVRAVNKNRIMLEDQEKRVDHTPLEFLQRHHAKKRCILNEIIFTTNYWTNEVSRLIETISCLVKNVMAECEEKENVKSPRKYRTMLRRVVNSLSTNDTKQKTSHVRSKYTKSTLVKKESAVETQMSLISNSINTLQQSKSKISTKPLRISRISKKEKNIDEVHASVDKKVVDSRHSEREKPPKSVLNMNVNQYKQPIPCHKYRTTNTTLQPVWRPGGAAKIPSSNSTAMLTQKARTFVHSKEKGNSENAKTSTHKRGNSMDHILIKKNLVNIEKTLDDNGKRVTKMDKYVIEEKHKREVNEFKKKPTCESCSTKNMVAGLNTDKIAAKRSTTSLEASSKTKSKARSVQSSVKDYNECLRRGSEHAYPKNYKNPSYCDISNQNILKESRVLRTLKEIIKATSEKKEDKSHTNLIHSREVHSETNSGSFKQPRELTKEEMKICEEEPTRDVEPTLDFDQHKTNHSKIEPDQLKGEQFQEDRKIVQKLAENVLVPVVSKNLIPVIATNITEDMVNGMNKNFENLQPKTLSSFDSETSGSCVVNFSSSSVCTDNQEAMKYCEASFNSISASSVSCQEQKNEKCKKDDIFHNCFLEWNVKQQRYDIKEAEIVNILTTIKKVKTKINPHAVSLSMLKEFLCDQGIDIYLVNKAEKCFRDKQKMRKYLKKKSISFVDMPSSIEYDRHFAASKHEKRWETKLQGDTEKIKQDFVNDKTDVNETSLQCLPKMKDTATCTVMKNSINAYSQTEIDCKISKSLQTIPENNSRMITKLQTVETQTEVVERNACLISNSLSVSDSSTGTVQVSYISKSVATDHTNDSDKKNLNKKFHKDNRDYSMRSYVHKNANNLSANSSAIQVSKSTNIESTDTKAKINDNDKDSSKECSRVLQQLLNQTYEEYDECLMNNKENEQKDEFNFIESKNASFPSDYSSSSAESLEKCNLDENTTSEDLCPVEVVSSEIVAALQVAAIRARNVYRAIDIYERKLKNKPKKRSKCKKKISQVFKACKEETKGVSRSNSVVKMIMHKKNTNKNSIIEMAKVLRQAEVTSTLSKSFDLQSVSEEETVKSIYEISSAFSSNESNLEMEFKVSKKSSSNVVLRDVKSLIEFLVTETGDVKLERIELVRKMSNKDCARFDGNTNDFVDDTKVRRRFSIFSREILLPLVYGIVCYVVFWCLQFTFTCDVIS